MKNFNLKGAVTPSPKYWWLNDESLTMLNRDYLIKGETVEQGVFRVTSRAAKRLGRPELQPLFAEMIERGWMSLSSPIWANMGTERGMPVSCFGVTIMDNMIDITNKNAEVITQTYHGGGTSGDFSKLRHRGASISKGGESNGPVAFMQLFDTAMQVISQNQVRRGSFAAYLDISHPDILEFLRIRDIGNSIQNLLIGVKISNEWMESMIAGDKEKRNIWARVLECRQQKGLPYIFFTDNVNNNSPEVYKALGEIIEASNLCSEISLSSKEDESFVCCLSSMNVALYDEWKDTDAVQLAIWFLDAVMSEFIEQVGKIPAMVNSYNFAKRQRALGLGVLGYHSYLQQNMIAFDSMQAKFFNTEVFKLIEKESKIASKELAGIYGPAPIFLEPGAEDLEKFRHVTRLAIAPTTSSSSILGQVSAGIEPFSSNYYKVGLSKGSFMRKNKELEKLLIKKGQNTEEVWKSIMIDGGSVLKLNFLTDEEKEVFKTFKEISQVEILNQAVARQKFIDQSQSLNVNIPASVPIKEVNKMYIDFWRNGGKTLYYQRSQSVAKELVNSLVTCSSCES